MQVFGMEVLNFILLQPAVCAFLLMLLSISAPKLPKELYWVFGILSSLITFVASVLMFYNYDSNGGMQFEIIKPWVESLNLYYHLAIDGISIYFIMLTVFLIPICFISSIHYIEHKTASFVSLFLLMESLIIGVFCALDIFLFYLFFESVLIPMFLIIGIWGGENKIYAALKFFLYTFLGSVFMLVALVFLYIATGTANVLELQNLVPQFSLFLQQLLFWGFFASFAVKVPMWPFHTWLPDAHVQAPTSGSMILAGVLLKLGGYGFLRFSLPMLPDASLYYSDIMLILSIIAVLYTSIVALMQTDMKKLIAYSSVAHMGFVTGAIFSFNYEAISGSIFQMLSHGLVSAALFLCVGVLYDRMHTKRISEFGGVTSVMPQFALFFMLFTMASVGLPGTSGFVGEFTILAGVFQYDKNFAILLAISMVLGAAYMLYLYKNVMYGEVHNGRLFAIHDLRTNEYAAMLLLGVCVLFAGIYPNVITDITRVSVTKLEAQFKQTE